jgi:hypothetical protein
MPDVQQPSTDPSAQGGAEAQPAEPVKERAALDGDGRNRPRFILSMPDDPMLEPLIEAFERGDYAYVRKQAQRVIDANSNPDVKAAAGELRRRIDPDPLVVLLLLLSLGLFGFLVLWTYFGR